MNAADPIRAAATEVLSKCAWCHTGSIRIDVNKAAAIITRHMQAERDELAQTYVDEAAKVYGPEIKIRDEALRLAREEIDGVVCLEDRDQQCITRALAAIDTALGEQP